MSYNLQVYLVCTGIIIFVLLILPQLSKLFKKSKNNPKQSLAKDIPETGRISELQDQFQILCTDGTDLDSIPGAYGKFGYEKTNPIPVNTIIGSLRYLKSLKTEDGKSIEYKRRGSTRTENIDSPIDIYDISANNEHIATLYISPYNKKNSEIAPEGFIFDKSNHEEDFNVR